MRWFMALALLVGCGGSAKPQPVLPLVVPPLPSSLAAADGTSCDLEDDVVCGPDGKSMLRCRNARWTAVQTCLAGDRCEKEGHFSCTVDRRAILECKSKTFAVEDTCKPSEGCEVRAAQIGCY